MDSDNKGKRGNYAPSAGMDNGSGRDVVTGKFLPGNPGKPYGAISRRKKFVNQLLTHADDLLDIAITQAKNGDTTLMALFIKTIIPNSIPAEIDSGDPAQSFAEGEISAKELKDITTAIEKIRNVEELEALRDRIAQLEQSITERSK